MLYGLILEDIAEKILCHMMSNGSLGLIQSNHQSNRIFWLHHRQTKRFRLAIFGQFM